MAKQENGQVVIGGMEGYFQMLQEQFAASEAQFLAQKEIDRASDVKADPYVDPSLT